MKQCPMCGLKAEDECSNCVDCGYLFSSARPSTEMSTEQRDIDDRPTGEGPIAIGYICLGLSVIFTAFAISKSDDTGSLAPYDGAASASFSLFLVFWAVGYIVKAISFLPRKDG